MTCFIPQVLMIESSIVQTIRSTRKSELKEQRDLELCAKIAMHPN